MISYKTLGEEPSAAEERSGPARPQATRRLHQIAAGDAAVIWNFFIASLYDDSSVGAECCIVIFGELSPLGPSASRLIVHHFQ